MKMRVNHFLKKDRKWKVRCIECYWKVSEGDSWRYMPSGYINMEAKGKLRKIVSSSAEEVEQ